MDEYHRIVLRTNQKLLQDVTITPDFLGKLHQHNVLPEDLIERVKNQTTESEQTYTLLRLLPKGGPDAFDRFVLVLEEANYYWITKELRSDLQKLKGNSTSQPGSTKSLEKGNQCDMDSEVCQSLNQENFKVIYGKMQSLFHLTEYEMNNNSDRTAPCGSPDTIDFETLYKCIDDVSVRVNQMETDIKSCYAVTGKRGAKLHVLLQEMVEEMRHDCKVKLEQLKKSISKEGEKSSKDFEEKKKQLGTENEMEDKNSVKMISDMNKELLKQKYENAMSVKEFQHKLELKHKELELKDKEIEQLKQKLHINIEHGEKQKTLEELRKMLGPRKTSSNHGIGEGPASASIPINARNDEPQRDIYNMTSRTFGKSQQGAADTAQHELSLIYRWLRKLHKRMRSEMKQEGEEDSSMDCSKVSLETVDTEISILLRRKRELEERIHQYEQLTQAEETPSGKKKTCIVNEKKSIQESGSTQLRIQVKQFKVEPAEKNPFQRQSERYLKSQMPISGMDISPINPTLEVSKVKQARAYQTKLMGRTNVRPKAKKPTPKKKSLPESSPFVVRY